MESRKEFLQRVDAKLKQIDPKVLLYNENEFWLIQQPYEFLENYAVERRLINTAVALPLARGLHNGTYRKFGVKKNGEMHKLPYYIHCLNVCRMLADIQPALSDEDLDCLLAAALCHDLIEDIPFKDGGKELMTKFMLDKKVYETVKLVSKRTDFSFDEEINFFEQIQANPLALMLKLSDRGNNVEDLYNMSNKKLREYTDETVRYFYPMSEYGIKHFPELSVAIHILSDKIHILTNVSKVMISKLEQRNAVLREERDDLLLEYQRLRDEWIRLSEEE